MKFKFKTIKSAKESNNIAAVKVFNVTEYAAMKMKQ